MSLDRLLLWRHGRTEWNVGGRFQGQIDTPLDSTGIEQAKAAAPYLAAERPSAIFCSDLSRAARTADALAQVTGLAATPDRRLRETSLGSWEGLDRTQVQARFPDEFAAWQSGRRPNPGNGELASDVAIRSAALVDELEQSARGTVVLVGHGGSLKALACHLLELPSASWPLIAPLRNCHWSELRRTDAGQWRLQGHNIYQLSDPQTLTFEELNVDSDAGDTQIAHQTAVIPGAEPATVETRKQQ